MQFLIHNLFSLFFSHTSTLFPLSPPSFSFARFIDPPFPFRKEQGKKVTETHSHCSESKNNNKNNKNKLATTACMQTA